MHGPLYLSFLRPSPRFRSHSLVIPAIIHRSLLYPLKLLHSLLPPISCSADDGSVPALQPLESDIEAFRTVIAYRRYGLTNRVAYIYVDAELALNK